MYAIHRWNRVSTICVSQEIRRDRNDRKDCVHFQHSALPHIYDSDGYPLDRRPIEDQSVVTEGTRVLLLWILLAHLRYHHYQQDASR